MDVLPLPASSPIALIAAFHSFRKAGGDRASALGPKERTLPSSSVQSATGRRSSEKGSPEAETPSTMVWEGCQVWRATRGAARPVMRMAAWGRVPPLKMPKPPCR
ncbi:MAG: hypothetical protein A2Z99_10090 [Treponema sp. GWB1_62_6]|nr:MAG: hypothetical protein A2Z99_10090 [Treponema sp. GWB1_62_6]